MGGRSPKTSLLNCVSTMRAPRASIGKHPLTRVCQAVLGVFIGDHRLYAVKLYIDTVRLEVSQARTVTFVVLNPCQHLPVMRWRLGHQREPSASIGA